MTSELLQNTRRINRTLQMTTGTAVSFSKLSCILGEVLNSNVYVVRTRGKILGCHLECPEDSSIVKDEENNFEKFPKEYTENILMIHETRENISADEALRIFPFEQDRMDKYTTVVPILGSGERLGTLILSKIGRAHV